MGVLVPIYLAGLAALSLPLIFHLVRRTPRGRQDFSSLMNTASGTRSRPGTGYSISNARRAMG